MAERILQCPKCAGRMHQQTYDDIVVDQCSRCQGLWFDAREHTKLKRREGSERIDSGEAQTGQTFNEVQRVACPVCQVPMNRQSIPGQRHIWYETCDVCGGVFLDAGEFRDFKEYNVADFFKDVFSGKRE